MGKQHPIEKQLLRLSNEVSALDNRIEAAVGEIKASRAEGDDAGMTLYKEVYNNLVSDKRELNAMRAALTTQLAGWSVVESPDRGRLVRQSGCRV